MNILITGANGFVGRALVQRLLRDDAPLGEIGGLTLVDRGFDAPPQGARVQLVEGSIAEPAVLREALDRDIDIAFHLASIPGGMAERNYQLGYQVNVAATAGLLEGLRRQQRPPRVVFASSIAVYGAPMPDRIDDTTPLKPTLSYGAHKQIGEILVNDFSRRGWIDGISLRLPGIVARPPQPSGLLSAFMSDIFWKFAAAEPFTCPVSPAAVAWWMSVACCADNLVHAAAIPPEQLGVQRACALPVLRFSIGELIEALVREYGDDRRERITFAPDEALESQFGRFPPLDSSNAEALGFQHDGSIENLIRNATAHCQK